MGPLRSAQRGASIHLRWTGAYPTQVLQPFAIVSIDPDPRMQREAVDRGAQLGRLEGAPVARLTEALDAFAGVRAEGDAALDRGGGQEGQEGIRVVAA